MHISGGGEDLYVIWISYEKQKWENSMKEIIMYELECRYPLTYKVLAEINEKTNTHTIIKRFMLPNIKASITRTELQDYMADLIHEVKEPIWSLCEDILNGNLDTDLEEKNKDNFKFILGGVSFKVGTTYHMTVDMIISPQVAKTAVESSLLSRCVSLQKEYILNGKPREELLTFYKERGRLNDI